MPPQKQHESKAARPHGMESVTLCRATTPDQRRAVVALVQSWFEREGQGTDPHYFAWQTDDGNVPADASGDELPWRDKASADGGQYTYYTVEDEDELEPIGAVVMNESSDAVWSLDLFAAEKGRGATAMGALLKHAFAGREEFRALYLEAADGASNHKLCRFYATTGWLQTTVGPATRSYLPTVAANGPPESMFGTADVHLLEQAAKVQTGTRAFVFTSTSFNTLMAVAGAPERTGTAVTAARRGELGDATVVEPETNEEPVRVSPALSEREIADAAYERA